MALANPREERGLAILAMGNQIVRVDAVHYRVRSQSGNGWYLVSRERLEWGCTCPDHVNRQLTCKHIFAVQFSLKFRQHATLENFGFEYQEKPIDICENCGSTQIIKRGFRKTKAGLRIQRYSCKACKHRFVIRQGYDRMKNDPKLVTLAMDLYYKGVSLRMIKDHIKQFYGVKVSHVAILKWITKYVKLMKEYLDRIVPNVSGVWHVDESMVNVRGSKMALAKGIGHYDWLWNLMDSDTRFILASQIHKKRNVKDAREVFQEAKVRAKREPALIVSDSLPSYSLAFKKGFSSPSIVRPEHLRVAQIRKGTENAKMERWHGSLKQRTKVMRGMHSSKTAQVQADGFVIFHNFIRGHTGKGMDGSTPAEKANINLKLGQNKWDSLIKQSSD